MKLKITNLSNMDITVNTTVEATTKDMVILHPRTTQILEVSQSAYMDIKTIKELSVQMISKG